MTDTKARELRVGDTVVVVSSDWSGTYYSDPLLITKETKTTVTTGDGRIWMRKSRLERGAFTKGRIDLYKGETQRNALRGKLQARVGNSIRSISDYDDWCALDTLSDAQLESVEKLLADALVVLGGK